MPKCEICNKDFDSEKALKEHIKKEHPGVPTSFFEEFMAFLEAYGVIGLAIALIIGLAVKDLVSAIVDDAIMPIIEVFLPAGEWQTATLTIGSTQFQAGHLLSAAIDFALIAFLVFAFVKYFLKKKKVEKI